MIKKETLITLSIFALLCSLFLIWHHADINAREEKEMMPLEQSVPEVEKWEEIIGSEEQVILNDDYQSGLIRRFYLDPNQKHGAGVTVSAFYKNGSEELFYKAWMIRTQQVGEALLQKNEGWKTAITQTPTPIMPLSTLRVVYKKLWKLKPGEKLLAGRVAQELIDDKNWKTLATRDIYFNKNSANEPDPIESQK